MQWRKSPQELIETFHAVLPDDDAAERRSMFGYPCCFANGQMFTGLHQENMVLRLPEDERTSLLRIDGARIFEPMEGRPMREYVVVPPSVLADPGELRSWVARSFAYVSSLPPKAKAKKAGSEAKAKKPVTAAKPRKSATPKVAAPKTKARAVAPKR